MRAIARLSRAHLATRQAWGLIVLLDWRSIDFSIQRAKVHLVEIAERLSRNGRSARLDGAASRTADSKVTFDGAWCKLGLEGDTALSRLGELVHYLDVRRYSGPAAAASPQSFPAYARIQTPHSRVAKHVSPVSTSLSILRELERERMAK